MRTGGSPVVTSREQAESLRALLDRLLLAPVVASPFSTTRLFQEVAMSGALDNPPAPEACPPIATLIRQDSPFMRGRLFLAAAVQAAEALHQQQNQAQAARETRLDIPRERPRG